MLNVIRLVTVHPVLVHFTLGGFAIVTIAYLAAAVRRSPEWTLVGDVSLVITAGITFATFAFGMVSNAALPWPGGIQLWRWLHLAFGAFLTATLGVLAMIRLAIRSRFPVTGTGMAISAIAIAALAAWNGWIGGEVLVYRAGMAVQAAGNGSLAPPVVATHGAPTDLHDGMARLRASWGSATGRLALMIVQHPTPSAFAALAKDGGELEQSARWLVDQSRTSQGKQAAGDPPTSASGSQTFPGLAQKLMAGAGQVQQSAQNAHLELAAHSTAEIESTCAACHEQFRWK